MKFIYMFMFLIGVGINSFSYNVDDYIFFNKALVENKKGDYKKSLFFYEIYQNNFSYSYPLTSNYAKYYIAKNYMDMKKYDEALLFFSRAVYVPESYVKQEFKKTNYFQYRRDYLVAEIYLKKNSKEEAYEYLTRLVTNYYDPELEPYEKKALTILQKSNIKYRYIYEIKYQDNLSVLKKLDKSTQLELVNYFYEKKEYEKVVFILEKMSSYDEKPLELKVRYLESLLKLDENKKVLELTKAMPENEGKLVFLRALAYEQSKDYSRAIFNYEKVQDIELENRANFRIGRIYYKIEEYIKARTFLDKTTRKNEYIDSLLLDIYIKLENKKKFIFYYEEFKNKYPENPKMGLYYMVYTKLINGARDPWKMANYNVFFASNYVVRNYIESLEEFNIKNSYKEGVLKEALTQIGELKNPELLDLAVQSSNFDLDSETTQDKVTIMNSFIVSGFYKESFKKMQYYKKDFYRYKNLLHYVYPKYYREEVQKARQKYLLPQSLIYTIMYIESGFDNENNKFERVGLMGIPKHLIKENDERYYNPEKNIEIGTSLLKKIYDKNNGMVLKTLIEYIYGPKVIKSLNFELDGDLKLETIVDEKFQKDVEEIVYTYAFYSAIYN
ncbi:transglycosylase SLT domain-containing protein [Candidatus Cetobacterium colombiensis]|uniref:Transglycosylase SLT domain-containing protein n=1 Tax=Candidatus Cetobacterium colombiensis TaxID=3073100 RepID=A0ABU4WCC7_9FUSO|nr:transglycosylase SLT domain-containing protein [Candidatus Cetobacterium colombiensis]MDX8336216.1 transglycosylase SLT domain-containing protein [Candidatus Cetobacterium colombiensis]